MMRVVERMGSLESRARDFGTGDQLYRSEIHTIAAIGDLPGVGITQLAGKLNVTKGAVSQMVRRLEKKKFVERTYAPGNARDVRLLLTENGKIAYQNHEMFHRQMRQMVQDHFGDRFEVMMQRFREVFTELDTLMDKLEASDGEHVSHKDTKSRSNR